MAVVNESSHSGLLKQGVDGEVPLNMLRLSKDNVRGYRPSKEKPPSIKELATLIFANGLMHRLAVVEAGAGAYEVVAGGRRLEALQLLAKEKKIAPDELIECRLYPSADAARFSFVENSGREDMHAADVFLGMHKMLEGGASFEEVAGRFGVSTLTVRRRSRLAQVAPELIALFREGGLCLEQLQALALIEDQPSQVALWNSLPAYSRSAHQLRSTVVNREVPFSHALVRFVGVEAFVAAGGSVRTDLFAGADAEGGYCCDRILLERLAMERLQAQVPLQLEQGWQWAEVRASLPFVEEHRLSRLKPHVRKLTDEESETVASCKAALAALEAEIQAYYQDEGREADEVWEREQGEAQGDLQARLECVQAQRCEYGKAARARGGVIITLDDSGQVRLVKGVLRPEAHATGAGQSTAPDAAAGDQEGAAKPRAELPERVVRDLSAHRTAAMQAEMLKQPRVALVALVHRLCESVLMPAGGRSCLDVSLRSSTHSVSTLASGYIDSKAGLALASAEALWREVIPYLGWEDQEKLFGWLLDQPDEVLMQLLAFLTAMSINVVKGDVAEASKSGADLAQALHLDMRHWWTATNASYFAHLPKAKAVDAVTQALGAERAEPLTRMKKHEAASAAEQALAEARWLPTLLS